MRKEKETHARREGVLEGVECMQRVVNPRTKQCRKGVCKVHAVSYGPCAGGREKEEEEKEEEEGESLPFRA